MKDSGSEICKFLQTQDNLRPSREMMTGPNGCLWKMSDISEVYDFMSRKAWIPTKRRTTKEKVRNTVPVKCVFNIKEDPDVLIRLKLINVVKGYIQVPAFDYKESFSLVTIDTSTIVMIGITLYHKE